MEEVLRKIVLLLNGPERSALTRLAEQELRDPRDQARLILRRELEYQGLLPAADSVQLHCREDEATRATTAN